MDKFIVETGNKDMEERERLLRMLKVYELWERQYHNTVLKVSKKYESFDEWSQEDLMKVAFQGVRHVKAANAIEAENRKIKQNYQMSLESMQTLYILMDVLLEIIGRIKMKNLIKIFPVTKDFDGEKWECKDYFYTMNVLKEIGFENTVGREGAFELLWDYQNRDLWEFTATYMLLSNRLYEMRTGRNITEEFFADLDVPSYSFDKESGIMVNNQTGEIMKESKTPSFMQVVK